MGVSLKLGASLAMAMAMAVGCCSLLQLVTTRCARAGPAINTYVLISALLGQTQTPT